MEIPNFVPVYGTIRDIQPYNDNCCNQIITVHSDNQVINFILTPETYVINNTPFSIGMSIVAFYDASLPALAIYPPQYNAVVMGLNYMNADIALNYFDSTLTASDNSLSLNISTQTTIVTANGQPYMCGLENKLLIVFYQFTTRSIPPQTTPDQIIVLC